MGFSPFKTPSALHVLASPLPFPDSLGSGRVLPLTSVLAGSGPLGSSIHPISSEHLGAACQAPARTRPRFFAATGCAGSVPAISLLHGSSPPVPGLTLGLQPLALRVVSFMACGLGGTHVTWPVRGCQQNAVPCPRKVGSPRWGWIFAFVCRGVSVLLRLGSILEPFSER